MAWASRLALGTVQFGLDYGISNRTGRVPPDGVAEVLAEVSAAGVGTLDTAVAYGESEAVLGAVLESEGLSFEIVSKFPRDMNPRDLTDTLRGSLRRLRVPRIQAYVAHDSECLKTAFAIRAVSKSRSSSVVASRSILILSSLAHSPVADPRTQPLTPP